MRREIVIPISTIPPYEAAAILFGIIAYPDSTDDKRRKLFEMSICYLAIRAMADQSTHWANSPQAVRPCHLLQDHGRMEKEWQRGCRIINDERLIAAKMAGPMVNKFNLSRGLLVPPSHDATSAPTSLRVISAVSVDLDERRGRQSEGNKGNIVARQWSPSKPVLHLCLGLHETLCQHEPPGARGLNMGDFFWDADLIAEVVGRAALREEIVSGSTIGIPADSLVQVRLQ